MYKETKYINLHIKIIIIIIWNKDMLHKIAVLLATENKIGLYRHQQHITVVNTCNNNNNNHNNNNNVLTCLFRFGLLIKNVQYV